MKVIKTIWFVACIAALIFTLSGAESEFAVIGFMLFMGILTFPIGIAGFYGVALLFNIVPALNGNPYIWFISAWVVMVYLAYMQWFVWVPNLYLKIRGKNA